MICYNDYGVESPEGLRETNYKGVEDAGEWMTPMGKLRPSGVVEVPANWHLDDCEFWMLSVLFRLSLLVLVVGC